MTKQAFVYALTDPRETDPMRALRYVGITTHEAEHRLIQHLSEARKTSGGPYRLKWLRNLLADQLVPLVKILEACPAEVAAEREQYWIKRYRESGARLTNCTDGGDGVLNPSSETRAKLSASARNRSPETREKLAKSRRGVPNSPEVRAKLAAAWCNYSQEKRARIVEAVKRANTGNRYSVGRQVSDTARLKMSTAAKARPHIFGRKPSPETLARIRASGGHNHYWEGKHRSDETKARIAASLTGRPGRRPSEEEVLRISLAQRGEKHPGAKLTWESAREIRATYSAGGITQASLARKYGVSQAIISGVIKGKKWNDSGR